MNVQREMTLQEWVCKLPQIHAAHKEWVSQNATIAQQAERITELECDLRQYKNCPTHPIVMRDKVIAAQATVLVRAREVLEDAHQNINPERSYAEEIEEDIKATLDVIKGLVEG